MAGSPVWCSMSSAPRDGTPILALCVHEADPYYLEAKAGELGRLTLYGAHTEGLAHVANGPHVVVWGGGFDDSTPENPGASLPDWWFQYGSEFELTANPVAWCPLPEGFEALVQLHQAEALARQDTVE